MKKALLLVICIIALCSLLTVTLLLHPAPSPAPTPTPTPTATPTPIPTPTPQSLQLAVTKAIDFFLEERQPYEPYALLMLNVMYRRFGITEFAGALQFYDQMLSEGPEQAPLLRVFRRIADHDNQLLLGDLQAVTDEYDRITVPALYCDQLGLPDDYAATLENAAGLGEYHLTHVLLACIWLQENNCEVPLPNGFLEDLYHANAALIGDDPEVTDLKVEAAAFLYIAGQGALVDPAFVERVIEVQNYDGGWLASSSNPGNSYWHTSIVGLLLLLHVEYPAESYPPMLAPASS